jgi:TPR repeat protein
MRSEMRPGDTIIEEPKRGQGASLTIRYLLPRHDSNSPRINEIVTGATDEARKWFENRDDSAVALAKSNPSDPDRQFDLAAKYKHGIGVPKNIDLALVWYRKAAEQGHAESQTELVEFFYYGDDVQQDFNQAALWARKAAEQGNAFGQLWMGTLYEKGQGVPQDYINAALWYREAVDEGFANAKWYLGKFYEYGQGVPQDYVHAYFWQSLAVIEWEGQYIPDHEKFTAAREETGAKLTLEEISAVKKRIDRWTRDHSPRNPR